jgi:outer membrane biosynthesis protein TonB
MVEKSTSAPSKPKPKIPQVRMKEDKPLPKKTRRPKQAAKPQTTIKNKQETSSGKTSNSKAPKGLRLDTEFNYPEYLADMVERIRSNWQYPSLSTQMMTTVYFKLGLDGRILRTFVKNRTGNIQYDSSAMNAVIRSAPFPPLPEDFKGDDLGVELDFIYEP